MTSPTTEDTNLRALHRDVLARTVRNQSRFTRCRASGTSPDPTGHAARTARLTPEIAENYDTRANLQGTLRATPPQPPALGTTPAH